MKILYTYRSKTQVEDNCRVSIYGVDNGVVLHSRNWDGRSKNYKVKLEAEELLKTAQVCLEKLGKISGVKYEAFVSNGKEWTRL